MDWIGTCSFLEEYERCIAPKLKEIDVFLKTAAAPYDAYVVADLLDVDADFVLSFFGGGAIDKCGFLKIMAAGGSRVCGMFAREMAVGSPPTYKAEQIAYIYELEPESVAAACDRLKIKEVTAHTMPLVFAQIVGTQSGG